MTNALATTTNQRLTTARTDDRVIELFIATKRSAHTRTQYTHSVDMFLRHVGKPLRSVTLEDAVSYHEHLRSAYSSAHSVRLHLNVAKSLYTFAISLGYLVLNPLAAVKADTVPEVTAQRILAEDEVLKLIDAPANERDKLLLRTIYAAGLRVSEVTGLMWADLSADGVLAVRGKGQKQRYVTLSERITKALNALRPKDNSGHIFTSRKGAGRLSEVQVHRIVKAAAQAAGINADASAHWLRHAHASHALDRGASVVTVRDTLGHASIATTNKYLHSKRNESSALHLAV